MECSIVISNRRVNDKFVAFTCGCRSHPLEPGVAFTNLVTLLRRDLANVTVVDLGGCRAVSMPFNDLTLLERALATNTTVTALNLTDAAIGPALAETMAVVLIHNAAGMCEPSRPYFLGCPPTRGTVGLPSPRLASPAGNKLSLGAPRLS